MLILSLPPATTSPVFAASREQLFYWGSVLWRGMGEITVKVHCFYSASSDVKPSSKYSFESCISAFDKVPHPCSPSLLFHPWLWDKELPGWMERGNWGSCLWTRTGPVLGRGFWHVVESSNLPCTRSQNISWHFGFILYNINLWIYIVVVFICYCSGSVGLLGSTRVNFLRKLGCFFEYLSKVVFYWKRQKLRDLVLLNESITA